MNSICLFEASSVPFWIALRKLFKGLWEVVISSWQEKGHMLKPRTLSIAALVMIGTFFSSAETSKFGLRFVPSWL